MQLTEIISKYGIEATEKALVYNYLTRNSINADDNTYIKNYLEDYEADESLMYDIKALNHASLAELAVDMELLIPESDRVTNGAFFTPQYIVDYIINESVCILLCQNTCVRIYVSGISGLLPSLSPAEEMISPIFFEVSLISP